MHTHAKSPVTQDNVGCQCICSGQTRTQQYTHQYFFSCNCSHIFYTPTSYTLSFLQSFSLPRIINSAFSVTFHSIISKLPPSTPFSFPSPPSSSSPPLASNSGKRNEDGARNTERREGRGRGYEAQNGRVTLEGILCQQAPVNQCNCVWFLKP